MKRKLSKEDSREVQRDLLDIKNTIALIQHQLDTTTLSRLPRKSSHNRGQSNDEPQSHPESQASSQRKQNQHQGHSFEDKASHSQPKPEEAKNWITEPLQKLQISARAKRREARKQNLQSLFQPKTDLTKKKSIRRHSLQDKGRQQIPQQNENQLQNQVRVYPPRDESPMVIELSPSRLQNMAKAKQLITPTKDDADQSTSNFIRATFDPSAHKPNPIPSRQDRQQLINMPSDLKLSKSSEFPESVSNQHRGVQWSRKEDKSMESLIKYSRHEETEAEQLISQIQDTSNNFDMDPYQMAIDQVNQNLKRRQEIKAFQMEMHQQKQAEEVPRAQKSDDEQRDVEQKDNQESDREQSENQEVPVSGEPVYEMVDDEEVPLDEASEEEFYEEEPNYKVPIQEQPVQQVTLEDASDEMVPVEEIKCNSSARENGPDDEGHREDASQNRMSDWTSFKSEFEEKTSDSVDSQEFNVSDELQDDPNINRVRNSDQLELSTSGKPPAGDLQEHFHDETFSSQVKKQDKIDSSRSTIEMHKSVTRRSGRPAAGRSVMQEIEAVICSKTATQLLELASMKELEGILESEEQADFNDKRLSTVEVNQHSEEKAEPAKDEQPVSIEVQSPDSKKTRKHATSKQRPRRSHLTKQMTQTIDPVENGFEFEIDPLRLKTNQKSFKAGDLPEHGAIKQRIQELLLHYRLDENKLSSKASNHATINKDFYTSAHTPIQLSVHSQVQIPDFNQIKNQTPKEMTESEKVSFLNFLTRQKTYIQGKQNKLETAKAQYMAKEEKELKFQPDTSKTNRTKLAPRNVSQFVQDMEIQDRLKKNRLEEMKRKMDKEIKKMASQTYISSGSKNILVKAGVELSRKNKKSRHRKKKSVDKKETKSQPSEQEDSSDSEFSLQDEGPRLLHQGQTLESNYEPGQSFNIQLNHNMSAPHLQDQRPSPHIYQQDTFRPRNDEPPSSSFDQVTKYGRALFENFASNFRTLARNAPKLEVHNSAQNIFNIQDDGYLQPSKFSSYQPIKYSKSRRQSASAKKQYRKKSAEKTRKGRKMSSHLTTMILNPFEHFMENTLNSKNFQAIRQQHHSLAQLKLKTSKSRFMRLADDSPYAKKKQNSVDDFFMKPKGTKKQLESKISNFLTRQNKDIEVKSKKKSLIDRRLREPIKVEILDQKIQPKKILQKSKCIMFKKFKAEFFLVLSNIITDDEQLIALNSFEFTQLITRLGCAKTSEMMNDESKVFKRCEELWTCLTQTGLKSLGENANGEFVSVDDTWLYMMAIFGIKGHKRMGISPPFSPERQDNLPVGFLNPDRQLCLSPSCVEQIQQRFMILHHNRNRFLIGKALEKREKIAKEMFAENTFKPNLISHKMTQKLLKSKKMSVQEETHDTQVPYTNQRNGLRERSVQRDYQRFIDSKNFWIQYNQQINQNRQVENCTFKPDITKSSKKVNPKTTYFPSYLKLGQSSSVHSSSDFNPFQMKPSPLTNNNHILVSSNPDLPSLSSQPPHLFSQPRFDQLYFLKQAMVQKRQQLSSVNREEQEFERQKQECTFKPQLVSKKYRLSQKLTSEQASRLLGINLAEKMREEVKQEQNEEKAGEEKKEGALGEGQQVEKQVDKQELKHKLEVNRIKSQEKMLELHKYAQMEREYQLKCFERGQPLIRPPPKLNMAEVQKKVNEKVQKIVVQAKEKPLLFIDIDIGGGKKDRLTVMKADSPRQLSGDFCQKHGLNDGIRDHLVEQIKQRIQQVISREKKQMEQRKAGEGLSPINEDGIKEGQENLQRPAQANSIQQQQVLRTGVNSEQEVGGRLMTQPSSRNNNPVGGESRSIVSNPNRVAATHFSGNAATNVEAVYGKPIVPQTEAKFKEQSPSKQLASPDPRSSLDQICSDSVQSSIRRQKKKDTVSLSASKSIDRIKNLKNLLIGGDPNSLEDELLSTQHNILNEVNQ